jgi:hypothetical protein
MWTWVTLSYSKEKREIYFFVNDELIYQMNGVKQNTPFPITTDLKAHDAIKPFILGFCPHSNIYYKGKIADVVIYNKFFGDVETMFKNQEDIVLKYENSSDYENNNVYYTTENIKVIDNILPFRRNGKFDCLPHVDEGYVRGKWAKGETTAKNEKRFVTEMQQRKIKYNTEGYNKIIDVLNIDTIDEITYPNTVIINVNMK